MQIKYDVYYKNYKEKRANNIGLFVDFWNEIDFARGRVLARKYFGTLVNDPNALFVLAREIKYANKK